MAIVNFTQAAKMAGVSRVTIHKHLKEGKLSSTLDLEGNKGVDTAELLRVYNNITPIAVSINSPVNDGLRQNITVLQIKIKLLREQAAEKNKQLADKNNQLQEYRQREHWLLVQLDKLAERLKQIEPKPVVQVQEPEQETFVQPPPVTQYPVPSPIAAAVPPQPQPETQLQSEPPSQPMSTNTPPLTDPDHLSTKQKYSWFTGIFRR